MKVKIQRMLFLLALGLSGAAALAEGRTEALRALLPYVPVTALGPMDSRWEVMFGNVPAGTVAISALPHGAAGIYATDLGPLARSAVLPSNAVLPLA
jgi:hypothetical protein